MLKNNKNSNVLKYGLVGSNIFYSKSPAIYTYWFKKYNINAKYSLIDTQNLTVDFLINLIKKDEFLGLNFTIPYKKFLLNTNVINVLHDNKFILHINEDCKTIENCNFLQILNNNLYLKNTDYLGLLESFIANNFNFNNKNILILGASATVLALIYAINKHCNAYKNLYIINRTYEKANEIVKKNNKILHFNDKIEDIDYIFNSTSLNFKEAISFFNIKINIEKTINYDLNYHFLYNDIKIITGKSMLLNQAKYNFNNWFGFYPTLDNELINNI